ncbi:winged helix DNA-binding domain-containing protein [Basidiobolus meristosporus CBS 931.73]|uniref:Vacuolar-sorting protein SNF8 n=1 Tax=Basidiobolus meristosporus CBS 931.73 TaxID=1314790 RepID=A0A1Y1YS34_9FUNG|nr:winged helix DNA-binding domain-containing protein [Basidiobolus meristosporus CBS 931.73]|eukprot:ORY00841.1 winged helix DNA-binding domain-containing protein [Basidiobolus meristosporus CBS 931.73]
MRRRGVGISGLQRQAQTKEQFREVGNVIASNQIEQMQSQLELFRTNLEEFAHKHRKDIRKDPTFRMHFQRMCNNIGIDPLASNKGFWGELLGVGDFYYELGIQIIQACMATRDMNGGLIDLEELQKMVEQSRGKNSQEITKEDIVRAIKTLSPLGSGFGIIRIGERQMVQSIPRELNKDQSEVLALAQESSHVNASAVENIFGWPKERVTSVMSNLLKDGLCWVDSQAEPEDEYWVPSFYLK